MYLLRTIFAILIALSIVTAPTGAAWAASADRADMAGMTSDMADDMDDCSKIGHGLGRSDCRCCDAMNACPPEFCVSKCFKVFREAVQPAAIHAPVAIALRPSQPRRPPDWSCGPQPPPPRT